jgi:hypothetical protein
VKNYSVHFFIGLAVLLVSCAQQVSPSGGDRDKTPPRILESQPLNGSVNFEGNSIILEFDEYVNSSGLASEAIVSPPLEKPFEVKMKGRSVTISWEDTLFENTTYTLQFGDGIKDVNENIALDSNVFVFSTGSYIDSFQMEGKVINAQTLAPVEDVWVMLYDGVDDSLPYLELPRYFAKTNEQGEYKLQYLAQGDFKIFALAPENKGYLFDQPAERISFLNQRVNSYYPIDSNRVTLPEMLVFVEEDTNQFVSETVQNENHGIKLIFNRPVEQLDFRELTTIDESLWSRKWNSKRDTLTFWFDKVLEYDSLKLFVDVEGFRDTIFLRKPKSKAAFKGAPTKTGLWLKKNFKDKKPHFSPLVLRAKTPLVSADFGSVLFIEGEDTVDTRTSWTWAETAISLDYKWKEGVRYKIVIPDSSIVDRFIQQNDSIKLNFNVTKTENFGELTVNCIFPEECPQYVWELLDAEKNVVDRQSVEPKEVIKYKHLKTGKYKVRLVFDVNQNGKWDSGRYLKGLQPEEVRIYDQSIEIRSNWTSEIDWNLVDATVVD